MNSLNSWHFPPILHNIITPILWELESWDFQRIFSPHHVSHVRFQLSHVRCHATGVTCQVFRVTFSHCHIFLDWLIECSFSSESSKHCWSQTVKAGKLKVWGNAHPPPSVTCHVSHVMCHVSCVMSHVSSVPCHVFLQGVWASQWRVCYQRGIPCPVYKILGFLTLTV